MHVVHLTASTMFGGPERQMLGLAEHLLDSFRTSFVSFREGGRCSAFLDSIRQRGFAAIELANDFPRLRATARELTALLIDRSADLVLSHGYKANVLGRIAARRAGIPIVGVSRGWTGENWKVRQYERLDRYHLRFLDRVVAVSDAQAGKVLATGVRSDRVTVIPNGSRLAAFRSHPDRDVLRRYFANSEPISRVVLSAGRLSPEKGFVVLVDAAAELLKSLPNVGFVHFGEGPERARIEARIRDWKLQDRFVLAGFTKELDALLPSADLVVLPSFTEGMPNVLLEAGAAGVASVATRVGGSPEVVADGETGLLVPPGDSRELARAMVCLLNDDDRRLTMGRAARLRMGERYSFESQAKRYRRLFAELRPLPPTTDGPPPCPRPRSNRSVPSGSRLSSTT